MKSTIYGSMILMGILFRSCKNPLLSLARSAFLLCWHLSWLHMPFTQTLVLVLQLSLLWNCPFSAPPLSYIFCILPCRLYFSCFFAQLLKSTVNHVFKGHCMYQPVLWGGLSNTKYTIFFLILSKTQSVYFLKAPSSAVCPWLIKTFPSTILGFIAESWVGSLLLLSKEKNNLPKKSCFSCTFIFLHL